ncbi:MAG: hypothetical protein V1836_03595 [Candidatus Aenigmatarchaeota archaeon]
MFAVAFAGPPTSSPASIILNLLEKYQAQQLVVPFLLTFVIAYGVLDSIKIFKKNSINAIVALAISFYAIFYGPYGAMGSFLTQIYGTGAVAIAGLVMIMIILGALSLGGTHMPGQGVFQRLFGNSFGPIVGIIVVVVMIYLLSTGYLQGVGINLDPDTTAFLIILLLIILFIYIIARPDRMKKWWNMWGPHYPAGGDW